MSSEVWKFSAKKKTPVDGGKGFWHQNINIQAYPTGNDLGPKKLTRGATRILAVAFTRHRRLTLVTFLTRKRRVTTSSSADMDRNSTSMGPYCWSPGSGQYCTQGCRGRRDRGGEVAWVQLVSGTKRSYAISRNWPRYQKTGI